MMMRHILLAGVVALGVSAPADAQGVSADDVARGFAQSVALCAKAALRGGSIGDVAASERQFISAAPESARAMAGGAAGPLWQVNDLGGIVIISEPDATQCNVTACGPRVTSTFDQAARLLTNARLGYSETQAAAEPDAIQRHFHKTIDTGEASILLDGSEPGMPSHAFRFSLLSAFVTHTSGH